MPGTYTNLLYHLVFSTKNRIPLIASKIQSDLYAYMGGIIRGEGGTMLQIGGMPDHVHLLIKSKPNLALSEVLKRIKGKSSKWLNERDSKFRKFGWQEGYAAFSVSESKSDRVRTYIRTQQTHYKRQSFEEELRALLTKHGIAFEDRYLID